MLNYKTILSLLLSITLTMGSLPLHAAADSSEENDNSDIEEITAITAGDVNEDGKADTEDSDILSGYFAGIPGYEEQILNVQQADFNGDGKLSRSDAMALARYTAGWVGYEMPPQKFTVKFILVADALVSNPESFESVLVPLNETVSEPVVPLSDYGTFAGWYADPLYSQEFDFSSPITEDTVLFAKWEFDTADTDGDGLYDDLEEYYKTDPNLADTDGDGLPDYLELNETKTDPLTEDTDGDKLTDDLEDNDEDGLTNAEELQLSSNSMLIDSDSDGLSDYDEVKLYITDPASSDTDGDGADDGLEISAGTDPCSFDESFTDTAESQPISETNPVAASVVADVPGDAFGTVSVTPSLYADEMLLSESIPGYLGSSYEFSADTAVNSAVITFEYDTSLGTLSEEFQPRIYYFNEETQRLEELPNQIVTEGKITAEITHFSLYSGINKPEFDAVYEVKQAYIDQVLDEQPAGALADSNDDGIPDVYNELIYHGILTPDTGSAEFMYYDFETAFDHDNDGVISDAEAKDFDGDGIINGDEIEVITDSAGNTYLYVNSNPVEYNVTDDMEDRINSRSNDLSYLQDDSKYNAALLETFVMNDNFESKYQKAFSGLGVVTTLTTTSDIYMNEWLSYLNDYSESFLENLTVNYEIKGYEDSLKNIKDKFTKEFGKAVKDEALKGSIVDTEIEVKLKKYTDARNAVSNKVNSYIRSKKDLPEMSYDEVKTFLKNDNIELYNELKAADAPLDELQSKYIEPKKAYTKATKDLSTCYEKVSHAINVIEDINDFVTMNRFYASINANIAAIAESRELFVKLKAIYWNNADIQKAAEKILEVIDDQMDGILNDEDAKFSTSIWYTLKPIVNIAIDKVKDGMVKFLSALGGPYMGFAVAIVEAVVGVGVARAQTQSKIFAQVYLANAAEDCLSEHLSGEDFKADLISEETRMYLIHLAQLRMTGEIEYAQSRSDLSNLKITQRALENVADNWNISLSETLLARCDVVTKANVTIKLSDDLYDKDPTVQLTDGLPSGKYRIFVNGEEQYFLREYDTISLYLTPGYHYTIDVVECHSTKNNQYYYVRFEEDIKQGVQYSYKAKFALEQVGTVKGKITYTDSSGKKVDCEEAAILFRQGHDNTDGDVYSSVNYVASEMLTARYEAHLVKGKYTAEVIVNGCGKQYFNVESFGYTYNDKTYEGEKRVSYFDFPLNWVGVHEIGGYVKLVTDKGNVPLVMNVQLYNDEGLYREIRTNVSDGAFLFGNVTTGKYEVVISHDYYVTDTDGIGTYLIPIDLTDGSYSMGKEYLFYPPPAPVAAHITGNIVDTSTGSHIEGDVKVSYYENGVYVGYIYMSDGIIDMTWAVETTADFVFEKEGYRTARVENAVIRDGENTLGTVEMEPVAVSVDDYTILNFHGHSYCVIEEQLSWTEAEEYCESLGGHLVTISSPEENHFLTSGELYDNTIYYAEKYWIGHSDSSKEGYWDTINYDSPAYQNWNVWTPVNDNGSEDYAIFTPFDWYEPYIGKGSWLNSDGQITDEYISFICEWDYILDGTDKLKGSGTCGDGISWTLDTYGVLTVSGTGEMEDYSNYYDAPWYDWYYNNGIEKIVIEDGITRIGSNAFSGIQSDFDGVVLEILSDDLISIAPRAFVNSCIIGDIVLPDSLEVMEEYAFSNTDISSIYIPASCYRVGLVQDLGTIQIYRNPFSYCANLSEIKADSNNFYYCSVDGVLYDKGMTTLVAYPEGNERTSFVIPEGVTTIENDAFTGREDSALKSLTISTELTQVSNIEKIKQMVSIENYAAPEYHPAYVSVDGVLYSTYMENLIAYPPAKPDEEYVLPNSVSLFHSSAFSYGNKIKSLRIHKYLSDVSAFVNLWEIEEFVVDAENPWFCSIDGVLYSADKQQIIQYPCGKKDMIYYAPDSVTSIASYAFQNCSNLVSIEFITPLSTVSASSFVNCSKLDRIIFRENVSTIIDGAFSHMRAFDLYFFGDSPDYFGPHSMYENPMIYYADDASGWSGNTWTGSDGTVYQAAAFDSFTFDRNIFGSGEGSDTAKWTLDDDGVLTISGTGAVFDSQHYKPWDEYGDIIRKIVIDEGITSIPNYTFSDSGNLTEVSLPSTLTSIGQFAFSGCTSLEEITIPAGVTGLGFAAFGYCDNLGDVYFEGNVPTVWENAALGIGSPTVHYHSTASGWTSATWTAPDRISYNAKLW